MVKLGRQQRWSEEENKRLLEFVLLHPYKILNSPVGTATIKLLYQYVNSNKTLENCFRKMDNLIRLCPNYENMVTYLIKITKVSQKWIEERRNAKIEGGIISGPNVKEIMSIS